jgi:hypothetical protein
LTTLFNWFAKPKVGGAFTYCYKSVKIMELSEYTLEQLYAKRDYLIMTTPDYLKTKEDYIAELEELNRIIFEQQQ